MKLLAHLKMQVNDESGLIFEIEYLSVKDR